jgi:hypothetical protein
MIKKSAGFLGVLAMMAIAPLARADFQISVNGVNCAPILVSATPTGSLTCASVSPVAGVTITNLSVSGVQAPGFSFELGTTLQIFNTTGSDVTLTIYLADSGFTSPLAPPTVRHSSGATLNANLGNNSFSLTSCVDQSNSLVPPGSSFCSSPAPGMAPPNTTLSTTAAQTKSNDSVGLITALSAPFSLTQQLVIVAGANSAFNVTSSQVLTPVPEPMSIALLGGVLLLTTGAIRRKQKQASRG